LIINVSQLKEVTIKLLFGILFINRTVMPDKVFKIITDFQMFSPNPQLTKFLL